MCGIAGVWMRQGEPDSQQLQQASRQLAHRGPDHCAVHVDGRLGLIHARLSIIDLAGGDQPLRSADDTLTLVANGEIYNYVELGQQADQAGFARRTGSDCELILTEYQARGLAGLERLHGMFAFALHDKQHDSLLLGRDRSGIKPLFVARLADRICFASELKALLPLLPQQPSLHPQGLCEFLHNQFTTGRQTIFREIERLLPGEYLQLDRELQGDFQRYYRLEAQTPAIAADETQALEQLDHLLDEVMVEHMRADVPFGLFLSGGIDSSVLLAQLSRHHPHPLRTFSVGFEGTRQRSELDTANALAAHFGTRHTALSVSRDQLFQRIVHSIWACDDLMRDYATLPTALLSETAAQELKVVFSGEGGDEAFAGYRRYAGGLEAAAKQLLFGYGGFRQGSQWPGAARGVLPPALRKLEHRDGFRDIWQQSPAQWSRMQRCQYVDIRTALADNLLVKTDRIMMSYGLEGRVPFSDHRLLEFGLHLPDWLKYRNGKGKWLLRQWAYAHLPHDHLNQPKRGFYVPVNEWLQGDFLRALADKLPANPAICEYFNCDAVAALLKRQQTKADVSRAVWSLMQFAIWHRLMVEQPGIIPAKEENPLDWL